MPVSFERVDDFFDIAVFHNVMVLCARAAYKPEHAASINRVADELLSRHPGIVVVSMNQSAVPASFAVRSIIHEFIARHGPRLLGAIAMLDGEGALRSARAAFLRGLMLLIGRPTIGIATSLDEAAGRVHPHAAPAGGPPLPVHQVVALLEVCREHLARGLRAS